MKKIEEKAQKYFNLDRNWLLSEETISVQDAVDFAESLLEEREEETINGFITKIKEYDQTTSYKWLEDVKVIYLKSIKKTT